MKRSPIKYSRDELDFIERHKVFPRRILTEIFNLKHGRNISQDNIKALCTRNGWSSGRTGWFQKGRKPDPRAYPKGPTKTSFKKGHVPANINKLWSERVNIYGYIEMKVPMPDPYTQSKTRYYLKHKWVWEQVNGPIPKGYCIFFLDGNKFNCEIENFILVSRAELLHLNKMRYDEQPAEARPAVLTLVRIILKAAERGK